TVHYGEAGLQERNELLVEDEELPHLHRMAAARHERRQRFAQRTPGEARRAGLGRPRPTAGELYGERRRTETRDLGPQRAIVGRLDCARRDRPVGHAESTDIRRHQASLPKMTAPSRQTYVGISSRDSGSWLVPVREEDDEELVPGRLVAADAEDVRLPEVDVDRRAENLAADLPARLAPHALEGE